MFGRQFNKKSWFYTPLNSLPRALVSIIIATISSLMMMGFLIWLNYSRLNEMSQRTIDVNRSYQVRLKNRELIGILVDMETGQRGFLLTANEQFLGPYWDGKKRLKSVQLDMSHMILNNDGQLARLDTLNRLVATRLYWLDFNLHASEQSKLVVLPQNLLEGKKIMDKIRIISRKIEDEETLLLLNNHELQQKADQEVTNYLLILSAVSVFFLLVFFRLLYIELARRIKAQTDLENKLTELEHANLELEQFAFIASHDLQEPLRKIRTFTERIDIKFGKQLPEDAHTLLRKTASSANRMQNLINDLLTLSRATAKDVLRESVNLNEILKEAQLDLEEVIADKKAVIKKDDLPTVEGIKIQFLQLFTNLLSNSLKYTQNGVAPIIRIHYEQVKGKNIQALGSRILQENIYHCITFMDNGIGFESQYAEKIFVIFQRLHNKNEYEGTGIGLALCRRIVNNHNGYILSEVRKNYQGSIFHVYLPIQK